MTGPYHREVSVVQSCDCRDVQVLGEGDHAGVAEAEPQTGISLDELGATSVISEPKGDHFDLARSDEPKELGFGQWSQVALALPCSLCYDRAGDL